MDLLKTAESLIELTYEAGKIEMNYYNQRVEVIEKSDGSPVTIADREAEACIEQYLTKHFPSIPFVGEEAVAAGRIPDISKGEFWLVDALDGTKSFIKKSGEFTVNIALMQNFKPVMGVIYIPAQDKVYYGAEGKAFLRESWNGVSKRIKARSEPDEGLTVMSSKRQNSKPEEIYAYFKDRNIKEIKTMSSSCKFCAVAEGVADLYPQLHETSEWDIAAGDAILTAAGGKVLTLEGKRMTYGKVGVKFNNPHFIAYGA